jgi:hypothetical protein
MHTWGKHVVSLKLNKTLVIMTKEVKMIVFIIVDKESNT